jgi:Lon protease-like protein
MVEMPGSLLPLFPLSLVLLPDAALPLHIFEERYKEMMAQVIPAKAEFGIVLAKEQGIANIGCTAIVERVLQNYDDGRMDLLAIGRRRFHILNLDDQRSYLRAEVEFFEDADDTPVPPALQQSAEQAFLKLLRAASEEPASQSALLSFQIAESINDLDKRQAVLSIRSEIERLRFLLAILPQYTLEQARTTEAKRLAPRNGHAKHIHSES